MALIVVHRVNPKATIFGVIVDGIPSQVNAVEHLVWVAKCNGWKPTYLGGNLTVRLNTEADELMWKAIVGGDGVMIARYRSYGQI